MATINTNTSPTDQQPLLQTSQDMKNALMIVSVALNLFIFTALLVIQVDPGLSLMLYKT